MDCNERIVLLEQEHSGMDDATDIRAKRDKVKEEIRHLKQEIDQFSVRQPFISLAAFSCTFRGRVLRMSRSKSTAI